jgi:hypothetical protein
LGIASGLGEKNGIPVVVVLVLVVTKNKIKRTIVIQLSQVFSEDEK